MKRTTVGLLLAAAVTTTGPGCMSVAGLVMDASLDRAPKPFAGTRIDVAEIARGGGYPLLAAIDLPFSFTVDTVVLPFILPKYLVQREPECDHDHPPIDGGD